MFKFFKGKSRIFVLMMIDLIIMSVAYWLLLFRVKLTTYHLSNSDLLRYYITIIICVFVSRLAFRVYRQMWRYASSDVYLRMVLADMFGGLLYMLIDRTAFIYQLSFANAVATVSVGLLITLAARFVYQYVRRHQEISAFERARDPDTTAKKINVAIVGAGELGVMLAKELLHNPNARYHPTYFFDNDPRKIGTIIEGIEVIGPDSEIIGDIHHLPVQEVILTLPNMDPVQKEKVFESYMGVGFKVLVFDYPTDRIDQEERRTIRDINIEDLLFRDPVNVTDAKSASYYTGKTVLVTGAGGSIGSELVRQLAQMKPERLVLLDVYENGVYDLGQELKRRHGDHVSFNTVIASVCNEEQIEQVFERYKPQVVFHAAAHKHVPLMEDNSHEAVYNNVFGTLNTANASERHSVERFLLISTDKAVNPTNVMGATKRMCEMIIQSRKDSKTAFVAVRFGNVLGSNGSVVPLFRKQIAEGGPVTITDKRIIRYFMTIPEAAQLVLKTGGRAERSEIYVLDMGKPVRIYDLALKLISLSGFVPEKDIEVREIGLRPGEKLYEELLVKTEDCDLTDDNRIFVERSAAITREEVEQKLATLRNSINGFNSRHDIREVMHQVIPTYVDPDVVNDHADESEEIRMLLDTSLASVEPGLF